MGFECWIFHAVLAWKSSFIVPWPHFSAAKWDKTCLTELIMGIELLHICQLPRPGPGTDDEPKKCQLLSLYCPQYSKTKTCMAFPSTFSVFFEVQQQQPLQEGLPAPKESSNSPLWAPSRFCLCPPPSTNQDLPQNCHLVCLTFGMTINLIFTQLCIPSVPRLWQVRDDIP